jgi:SAM-dependent methyltransferase
MFSRQSLASALAGPSHISKHPHLQEPDGGEGNLAITPKLFARMVAQQRASILELGTKRVDGRPPSIRKDHIHPTSKYVGTDSQEGLDVDVVADAEQLSTVFGDSIFDIVLACSVYEHLSRPWIVTPEIAKVLKPGGWAYIQTHHTFPLHGFPQDFYRYSRDALELLCRDAGLHIVGSCHQFPAIILSPRFPGEHPAFLNSVVLAEKR